MSVLTMRVSGGVHRDDTGSSFAFPERRWLALYNVMLPTPKKHEIIFDELELAPIQKLFPEELMHTIFSYLGPYSLGKAACVCKQWRFLSEHPRHWQAACQEAFGAVEWRHEKAVHLVTYFRYFRFFPDGSLLYRTSPHTIKQVVKTLLKSPGQAKGQHRNEQFVYNGRYVIKGGKVFLVIVYPNSRNTEVRARCAIRGVPCLGAANRLDLEDLLSYDKDTATSASMIQTAPDEVPEGAGAVTSYRRGLSPCVFVTWEGVATSLLNLPAKDMDVWLPG
eukprot:gene9348-9511_t